MNKKNVLLLIAFLSSFNLWAQQATKVSDVLSCSAKIVPTASFVCSGSGNCVTLDASTTGGANYTYVFSTSPTTSTAPPTAVLGSPDYFASVCPTITTTYTVTISNGAGCTATASQVIVVNNTLTAVISGNFSVCNGKSTQLTASGGNNYLWNSSATVASIIVTPTVTSSYTVTVTTANCMGTQQAAVTVNPNPTASVVAGRVAVCSGEQAVYALAGLAGSEYHWHLSSHTQATYGRNDSTATVVINWPQVNTAVTDTLYVKETSNQGCPGNLLQVLITINPLPVVHVAFPADTICSNAQAITLSGGTPVGGTYSGVGVSNGKFNPSGLSLGNYMVKYSYGAPDSCYGYAFATIKVVKCNSAGVSAHTGPNRQEIAAYPNPFRNSLDITGLDADKINHIKILNLTGTLVKEVETPVKSGTYTLDLGGLPAGVYFLKCNNAAMMRVVKE